jgi:hypothetical protein
MMVSKLIQKIKFGPHTLEIINAWYLNILPITFCAKVYFLFLFLIYIYIYIYIRKKILSNLFESITPVLHDIFF